MSDVCVPPDQEKTGAHWLKRGDGLKCIWVWSQGNGWDGGDRWVSPGVVGITYGYRYLRPVLTPEQEDALHAAEIDALTATVVEQAATIERITTEWRMAQLLADDFRRQREELRTALTEATTARDEAAGDAVDLEWRVM